jgi:hypothetical protein
MNGITVTTEHISCLRFSNFEAMITTGVITRMGISRHGIQSNSGSPQHETKVFQYKLLTNVEGVTS